MSDQALPLIVPHDGDQAPSLALTRAELLRTALGVVVAGGVITSLAACGGSSSSSSSSSGSGVAAGAGSSTAAASIKRGGTLQVATDQLFESDSLDPLKAIADGVLFTQGLVREGLSYTNADLTALPRLAEWETNSDFTEYTLRLRRGAKFHDGKPLTADDVKWSLSRQLDPKLGSQILARLTPSLDLDGIVVVDANTIKLKLKRSDSQIMGPLARTSAYIVQEGTTNFNAGVGTGPFKMKSWSAGQHFEVVRNPDYWEPGVPYLDTVRTIQIPEASTKTNSVISGPSHITEIDYQSLPLVKASHGVKVSTLKNAILFNVVMDQTVKPWTDPRVREALKRSIDRQKVIDVAYAGYGRMAPDTPINVGDPLYSHAMDARLKQDVDGARQLMKEAGHPDGITLTLDAPSDPVHANFALAVASTLSGSPFTVNVQQHPGTTYWDKIWMHGSFYVSDWNHRAPIEAMTQMFSSATTTNEARFKDPKLDAMLAKALGVSGTELKSIIDEALTIVSENAGNLIPAYRDRVFVAKAAVEGVLPSVTDNLDLRRAWLKA